MAATSTSSTNVFPDLEKNKTFPWIALLLMLCALPMPLAFNSISLVLFAVFSLRHYWIDRQFSAPMVLLLPVALYLLMAASRFWTVDVNLTVNALSKEISLIVVPLCFMMIGKPTESTRSKLLLGFGWGMTAFSVFSMLRAVFRYFQTSNADVFFYHELVTLEVNAIHVSVFAALGFFVFYTRNVKALAEYLAMSVLFAMVVLLSSKNVTLVFIALMMLHALFFKNRSRNSKLITLAVAILLGLIFALNGKVRDRFAQECQTLFTDNTINTEIGSPESPVYNVSVRQAWSDSTFAPNQYFSGTAFRVYQARIFFELMQRDNAWLQGYGLNASYPKIGEMSKSYNLYQGDDHRYGYHQLNFHNQYLQMFAELGIVGFLLLLVMLGISLRKAIQHKDFVHISFTVLMITVFLTESFLWRQRGMTCFIALYCLMNLRSAPNE